MGLFSSLFGPAASDQAQKDRQNALNAFNAVKTPQLADLQVQLDKEVSAGTLTPAQAEAQLLGSNAFNDIKTDPSLTGAAKQALNQLQQIGTQGGMTAIDKAQLQDITNQTNQLAQSRNASVLQNAQERGIGGSGLELANTLNNEQAAADRASQAGTTVAANAQQRALQAIQAAGGLGQSLESQAYGEQANKAQAQNAIDLFNTQTANATNLYNTGTANQAQAQNLANAQNIANTNTGISNQNKTYNAAQNQQIYNDELQKASGIAGVEQNAATAAQTSKNQETGADLSLIGNGLKAVGTGAGFVMGGPMGAAAANGVTNIGNGRTTNSNYTDENSFSEGGEVMPNENRGMSPDHAEPENKYSHECYSEFCLHPEHDIEPKTPLNENKGLSHAEAEPENKSLEDAYNDFVKSYCYGGSVKMADGGMVTIKSASKDPIHTTEPHGEGYSKGGAIHLNPANKGKLHEQLHVAQDKPIPSGKLEKATHSDNETLRKRAQFAENAKHFNHSDGGMVGYAEGGMADQSNNLDQQNQQLSDKQKTDLAIAQSNSSVPTAPQNRMPVVSHPDEQNDKSWAEKLGELLSSHATQAKQLTQDENAGGMIHDFRSGGQVPGIPKVAGDSPKNDIVPAKLSPGEIVLPRSVVQNPVKVPNFVNKTLSREDPTSIALRKLRNAHLNQGA